MGFFSKFFNSKSNQNKAENTEKRGKYMPETKRPIDERFTINFNKNGGKFLYCETVGEVYQNFHSILEENNWVNEHVFILDVNLEHQFKSFNLKHSKSPYNCTYFFSTCEYLIADDGAILVSSNQVAEKKTKELPENIIIYATTSQLVENISEGLKNIKLYSKRNGKIPTNITTLKNFKETKEEDFLTYGQCPKNLYLLLLEDL